MSRHGHISPLFHVMATVRPTVARIGPLRLAQTMKAAAKMAVTRSSASPGGIAAPTLSR